MVIDVAVSSLTSLGELHATITSLAFLNVTISGPSGTINAASNLAVTTNDAPGFVVAISYAKAGMALTDMDAAIGVGAIDVTFIISYGNAEVTRVVLTTDSYT